MVDVTDRLGGFPAAFEALTQRLRGEPEWLSTLRSQAFGRFTEVGFPTMKHEEWRFTNLAPLLRTPFDFKPVAPASVTKQQIAAHSLPEAAVQLVFVDGVYRAELSTLGALPRGATVMSLREALGQQPEKVRPYLGQFAGYHQEAFTALNTAMLEDGAFIHVAAKTIVEAPIHLLFVATPQARPTVSHPRHLIVAEAQSSVEVVEHYVTLGESVYFTNAVTEAVVGANARVHHYFLEFDSASSFAVSTLRVQQERSSQFESHTALFGGAIVRNNVHVELQGPGCESLVNGLYLPQGSQHHDNHMRVVHAQPHCDSRQFYKGVLDGKSSGVFSGRIVVHEGAQKTDAKQTNRNLLLTDEAHVDTKPQLEIYADDVKCTHGATIGQLDEDQLFYLRARGVPADAAKSLLIFAFAHESLERMTLTPVRTMLEKMLFARLPGAEDIEAMLL